MGFADQESIALPVVNGEGRVVDFVMFLSISSEQPALGEFQVVVEEKE
jgi:hypothetical protein